MGRRSRGGGGARHACRAARWRALREERERAAAATRAATDERRRHLAQEQVRLLREAAEWWSRVRPDRDAPALAPQPAESLDVSVCP